MPKKGRWRGGGGEGVEERRRGGVKFKEMSFGRPLNPQSRLIAGNTVEQMG